MTILDLEAAYAHNCALVSDNGKLTFATTDASLARKKAIEAIVNRNVDGGQDASGPDAPQRRIVVLEEEAAEAVDRRLAEIYQTADVSSTLDADIAYTWRVAPIRLENGLLTALAFNPNPALVDVLKAATRRQVKLVKGDNESVSCALARLYSNGQQFTVSDEIDKNARRRLNAIIDEAINQHASDVHVMREAEHGIIGYRIDRTLIERERTTITEAQQLVNMIATLANTSDNEVLGKGAFLPNLDSGRKINVRVQILPSQHGDEAIMRLLGSALRLYTLDQLGMPRDMLQRYEWLLANRQGLHLVVGPQTAGKTTTLLAIIQYVKALLSTILKTRPKIVSAEDPVEIPMAGVTQIEINEDNGVTFAAVARAFLRSDPDLIVIGELRDQETFSTFFEAGLFGRPGIGSAHANDALAMIGRLREYNISPALMENTLKSILAQRTIPKLCLACREKTVAVALVRSAIEKETHIADVPKMIYRRGNGCKECNGLAVSGVVGVFELLPFEATLIDLISKNAAYSVIQQYAEQELDYVPFSRMALEYVANGVVSYDDAREALNFR